MAMEEYPLDQKVILDGEHYYRWKTWLEEQEERNLHRGDWWLTPAGRELIEETWPPEKYNDGNCVRPLYDQLVELESDVLEFAKERENFMVQIQEKEILLNDLAQLMRERDNAVDDLRASDRTLLDAKTQLLALSRRLDAEIADLTRVCKESGAEKNETPQQFIRRLKAERDGLQEAAASKQPHSFAIMSWACGHRAASSCLQCFHDKCHELDELKSFQKEKENEISSKTPPPTIEGLMATIDHNIEQMHSLGREVDRLLGENARMVDEISDLRIKLGKYEPVISNICGYTDGKLNCTFWKNACDQGAEILFKLNDEIVRLKAAEKTPALDQMETFVDRKTEEQNTFSENLSRNETFKIMVATIYNRVRQTTPWDGEDSWETYMVKCWQQAKDEALFGLGMGLT